MDDKDIIKFLQESVDTNKEALASETYRLVSNYLKKAYDNHTDPIYELSISYVHFIGSDYMMKSSKFLTKLKPECNCVSCDSNDDASEGDSVYDCDYKHVYEGSGLTQLYDIDILDIIESDLDCISSCSVNFLSSVNNTNIRFKAKNLLISSKKI